MKMLMIQIAIKQLSYRQYKINKKYIKMLEI